MYNEQMFELWNHLFLKIEQKKMITIKEQAY